MRLVKPLRRWLSLRLASRSGGWRGVPRLALALALVPVLAGARCAVVASSGTDGGSGLVLVVGSTEALSFAAPTTAGLRFEAGTRQGLTGSDGRFTVVVGDLARFRIGDIQFGSTRALRRQLSLLDLVPGATLDQPAVINRARLLYSLDADLDDLAVTIPPRVDAEAVTSNPDLGTLVATLDFADDANFDAVAPNLVAQLTRDYGFTVVLLDRSSARQRLEADLQRL